MSTRAQLTPAALSRRDASRYLGVSATTLWRLSREGVLPRVKVRGRTLYRRDDLDTLLETAGGARPREECAPDD